MCGRPCNRCGWRGGQGEESCDWYGCRGGRWSMQSITGFWSVEHSSLSFLCWCWHSCSVKFTGHWEERISSAASLPDLGDEAMKICWYKYHWYYSEDIRWICQDENPEENIENWRPNTGKKKRLRFWFNAEMSAQLQMKIARHWEPMLVVSSDSETESWWKNVPVLCILSSLPGKDWF